MENKKQNKDMKQTNLLKNWKIIDNISKASHLNHSKVYQANYIEEEVIKMMRYKYDS